MFGMVPFTSPPPGTKRKHSNETDHSEIVLYALISLGSFLCASILLGVLVWRAEFLSRLSLIGNFYYPILLAFGLCAAVFLFGVLHSYASYRGRHFGGGLQLGGPVVVFSLVVAGARIMVPNAATFSITLYVHGPRGHQDAVLQNTGAVSLDLDERVTERIGDKGQAVFPAIQPRFRDQEVQPAVESDSYELAHADQSIRLTPPIAYLEVRLRKGHVRVHVMDPRNHPISRAEIRLESQLLATTDKDGYCEAEFALHAARETPKLYVSAKGYEDASYEINPMGERVVEILMAPRR
jgi:hypothetical protein